MSDYSLKTSTDIQDKTDGLIGHVSGYRLPWQPIPEASTRLVSDGPMSRSVIVHIEKLISLLDCVLLHKSIDLFPFIPFTH